MSAKKFLIVGATAPDVLKLVTAINNAGKDYLICEGFLDDDPAQLGRDFMGYPVLGTTDDFGGRFKEMCVVNNVARDMPTRMKVVNKLSAMNVQRLTLIHPSVEVHEAQIGAGCIIQEGVVLGPLSVVGDDSVLYAHAVIGHECTLGRVVFVANNAIVGARSRVGDGAFIGLNSVVLPSLSIGAWSTVGAGAIVLRDVEPNTSVFGNPARPGVRPSTIAHEA